MDYSEILRLADIDIDYELRIIRTIMKDEYQLYDIRKVINLNYHLYPFSDGTINYNELFDKIYNLSLPTLTRYLLCGQIVFNLFNFVFDKIKKAKPEIIYIIHEQEINSTQVIKNKILYIYDKLGYETSEVLLGGYNKVVVMEKNSLARSVAIDIKDLQLSTSILKYNYIDSSYETKRNIILSFYRFFDKNQSINTQLNNSTNGIKRTYKNLLRIMETLKHGANHPQALKFVLADTHRWTDISYNLSLEVFRHLLNRNDNLDFEQSLSSEENK